MKQLPNYSSEPSKIKKSWIPLAIFALICNVVIAYIYIDKNKNIKHSDASVHKDQRQSSNTNPNIAIEPLKQPFETTDQLSNKGYNASEQAPKQYDINQSDVSMEAIIVKKTTSQNEGKGSKIDSDNSTALIGKTANKDSELEIKNKEDIASLKSIDIDNETIAKDSTTTIATSNASNEKKQADKKAPPTATNTANAVKIKSSQTSDIKANNNKPQATVSIASAQTSTSQVAKANNQVKSSTPSAVVNKQVHYGKANESTARVTVPTRQVLIEQDIHDASLLAIDLPATKRKQIPTNSSATRDLQAKTLAVKSNTEALQNQLSDSIKSIKDINQQKIERERQMAQRAYDDLQRMNKLKQQQKISQNIEKTEEQLEKNTLTSPPSTK